MSTRTLTATMPSDTLYVSGTVNGVTTTWTNTQGQTWSTVAERSANDIYVVALTIINSVGAVAETTFTLYYSLHLVTDRTQADVTAKNEKGTYGASDLNRVGAAINYVADKLREMGYAPRVSPKSDWSDLEWLTPNASAAYLADLEELRRQFAMMQTTPGVPDDMERLTYQKANNIEKILEDINFLLTKASNSWFFGGELFSGEV